MSRLAIAAAGASDLEDCALLFDHYRQFQGRPADLDAARAFLRERLAHGDSVVFIARDGAAAAGFAQLYPSFSSVSLARTFVLNDLFVMPALRDRGIGSRLLEAVEAHARTCAAVRLTLNVAHTNPRARALYASRGWAQDQTFATMHRQLA